MSFRTHVALAVAAAVAIVATAISIAAYFTVSQQLGSSLDTMLLDRARAVMRTPLADPSELLKVPADALGASDITIGIVNANTQEVTYVRESGAPPVGVLEVAVAQGKIPESVQTVSTQGQEYRVAAVELGNGYALVLAQSNHWVKQTLDQLRLVLVFFSLLSVALGAVVGWSVARTGLRPIERLRQGAQRVATTGDLTPIQIDSVGELGQLADQFNTMLAALAASQRQQRDLVADAGHELRTPLTSMRTNIELLIQARSQDSHNGAMLSAAEEAEILADVHAQLGELTTLMDDLMELSRNDQDQAKPKAFSLVHVVLRAAERVGRRRANIEVHLPKGEPPFTFGDERMLERAVINILDNAVKFSPADSTIHLSLSSESESTLGVAAAQITVTDAGPGFTEADAERVFERFWRSSTARATPGSGLGLAIVADVARRHHGTVAATNRTDGHTGACVTLTLPLTEFSQEDLV